MWDFSSVSSGDSIDWEDPDPATIRNRILDKTESGSILLFHNDLENTEQALPSLLTELKQKGFEFAAVEDMIYTENYTIDNTGKQIYQPAAAAAERERVCFLDAFWMCLVGAGVGQVPPLWSLQKIFSHFVKIWLDKQRRVVYNRHDG